MKDSGQREEFSTGAVRDSREGKGRYDLIPVIALKRVAAVYEKGASKYSARNWETGINQSRCYDSALRHLMQYAEGLRDEDHLAQAAFNVLAMIFTEEQVNRGNLPASLMDLPSYLKKDPEANLIAALERLIPGDPPYSAPIRGVSTRAQSIDDILPKRKCDDDHYAHPAHTYTKISAASNEGSIRYRCPGASFDRT